MRAAEAVELALRSADPKAEVANYDVLSMMPAAFRTVYRMATSILLPGLRNSSGGCTTGLISRSTKTGCRAGSSGRGRRNSLKKPVNLIRMS